MTRRRLGWALLSAVGVLVSVGAPIGWSLTRPAQTVGAGVAESLADSTPAPAVTARPARPRAASVPAVPAVPITDGRLGAVGGGGPEPVRLELPSLGVAAPVTPIGVTRNGDLEIPANVGTVGWYRFGSRPGDSSGSTVLSGHVDSAEQGRGAFFRLRDLRPGDPVVVRGGDGRARRYRVVAREEWPKSAVPMDRLFSRGGAARLTLVTCGGGFREDIASYRDNIAVTAVPAAVG
jgi:Sortase domain